MLTGLRSFACSRQIRTHLSRRTRSQVGRRPPVANLISILTNRPAGSLVGRSQSAEGESGRIGRVNGMRARWMANWTHTRGAGVALAAHYRAAARMQAPMGRECNCAHKIDEPPAKVSIPPPPRAPRGRGTGTPTREPSQPLRAVRSSSRELVGRRTTVCRRAEAERRDHQLESRRQRSASLALARSSLFNLIPCVAFHLL